MGEKNIGGYDDYNNSNVRDNTQYPYKYSCETKCVNVVLQGITLNTDFSCLGFYIIKKGKMKS